MKITNSIRRKIAATQGIKRALILTTFMQEGLSRATLNGGIDYKPSEPEGRWTGGLPDTVQYGGRTNDENRHIDLAPRHQNYWYKICKDRAPGFPESKYFEWFEGMTTDDRWTTNDYGSNSCAVYPTGKHLDREAMRFFTLFTGLTVVEVVGPMAWVLGGWQVPFRAINAALDFDHITPETHPLCFYEPMNSTRIPLLDATGKKWLHGEPRYIEDGYSRFHQFNYRSVTPIWMPNTDVGWVPAGLVRFLAEDEIAPTFNR